MTEENARPLVPGISYRVMTHDDDFVLTLRAVEIAGKQHWSFHTPGNPDSVFFTVVEL